MPFMKNSIRVSSPFLLALLLFCTGGSLKARAQGATSAQRDDVKITLDYESARAVLNLFDKKEVPDEELTRVVALPGNQGLIRQGARFDPKATPDNFKASLKKIIETGSLEPDTFALTRVKARLPQVRALLNQIEENPQALTRSVTERVLNFAPAGVKVDVKVYFILGGTSDGFAPNDKNFFVALDYFEDDVEGLKLLMAHELYHNAQKSARKGEAQANNAPQNVARSLELLRNTLDEGTASVVGDPLEIQNAKGYVTWFQMKYRKNIVRMQTNFALLDSLLYRLYTDPNADSDKLYNIGFSGIWESPLYFVGYRMAKVIEKYKGRAAIATAIGRSPLEFFNLYVEIYKAQNDPEIIRFSKSTEEILQKLAPQKK